MGGACVAGDEVARLRCELNRKDATIDGMASELRSMEARLALVDRQLLGKDATINRMASELRSIEDQLDTVHGRLLGKDATIDRMASELRSMKERLALVEGRLIGKDASVQSRDALIEEAPRARRGLDEDTLYPREALAQRAPAPVDTERPPRRSALPPMPGRSDGPDAPRAGRRGLGRQAGPAPAEPAWPVREGRQEAAGPRSPRKAGRRDSGGGRKRARARPGGRPADRQKLRMDAAAARAADGELGAARGPQPGPRRAQSGAAEPGRCVDSPVGWADQSGDGCHICAQAGWCTPDGGFGTGWDESWGTFEDFAEDSQTAATACCACGGGHSCEDGSRNVAALTRAPIVPESVHVTKSPVVML